VFHGAGAVSPTTDPDKQQTQEQLALSPAIQIPILITLVFVSIQTSLAKENVALNTDSVRHVPFLDASCKTKWQSPLETAVSSLSVPSITVTYGEKSRRRTGIRHFYWEFHAHSKQKSLPQNTIAF